MSWLRKDHKTMLFSWGLSKANVVTWCPQADWQAHHCLFVFVFLFFLKKQFHRSINKLWWWFFSSTADRLWIYYKDALTLVDIVTLTSWTIATSLFLFPEVSSCTSQNKLIWHSVSGSSEQFQSLPVSILSSVPLCELLDINSQQDEI